VENVNRRLADLERRLGGDDDDVCRCGTGPLVRVLRKGEEGDAPDLCARCGKPCARVVVVETCVARDRAELEAFRKEYPEEYAEIFPGRWH
jgi:hypothetical protein